MTGPRLDRLRAIVAGAPDDPAPRYFLAHELFRAEDWAGAAEHYGAYVRLLDGDTGAAFKNLGLCFERLGRADEAEEAYRRGIAAAAAHGHDGLAAEIEMLLEALAR